MRNSHLLKHFGIYERHNWFEWSFHSVVVDLWDAPLLQEEI
jgi:hypothetical protein